MKNIFYTFSLVLFSFHLSAQIEDFRLGVHASPAFSWFNTDNNLVNSNGLNTVIHIGLMGDLFFSESFSLNLGLGIAFNRGGTLRHDIGGNLLAKSELSDPLYNTGNKPLPDGVDLKYHLQYLEIPVALRMRTKEFGYIRYYIEAPILSTGLLTQARGDIEGIGIPTTERENIKKDVSPVHFSWGFGGGIEYGISQNSSVVIGFIFNSNLTDVTKNFGQTAMTVDDNGTPTDFTDDIVQNSAEITKAKVNTLSLRLGIFF